MHSRLAVETAPGPAYVSTGRLPSPEADQSLGGGGVRALQGQW